MRWQKTHWPAVVSIWRAVQPWVCPSAPRGRHWEDCLGRDGVEMKQIQARKPNGLHFLLLSHVHQKICPHSDIQEITNPVFPSSKHWVKIVKPVEGSLIDDVLPLINFQLLKLLNRISYFLFEKWRSREAMMRDNYNYHWGPLICKYMGKLRLLI